MYAQFLYAFKSVATICSSASTVVGFARNAV
jgi:hypothetical protein